MTVHGTALRIVIALAAGWMGANWGFAQASGPRFPGRPSAAPAPRGEERQSEGGGPSHRVAETPTPKPHPPAEPLAQQHPLEPVLKMAYEGLEKMDKTVVDYTATVVKRERINGKLGEYEYMFTKVRHKPFSVYLYFLGPENIRGREVIYVAGKNEGKLVAHEGSGLKKLAPRVYLAPDGPVAMRGQRYPITEMGIRTLTQRLIEVGEHDKQFEECEVKFFKGAKVQDRTCTCLQVVHPTPRKQFRFHLARIYIDDELQLPIRYESFDWPRDRGGAPVLLEEYTYMKLKLNVGLTDADFDPDNANYKF